MKFDFPKAVDVPPRLSALIAFCKTTGDLYPCLELKTQSISDVAGYFGKRASAKYAAHQLGVFAGGPDGSSYAVWRAPQGGFPVVLLGSEGDNHVVAASFDQFLGWLSLRDTAESYQDPGSANGNDDKKLRKAFRAWIKSQKLKPPKDSDVFDSECLAFSNFAGWCEEAIAGTLSAKTNMAPIAVTKSSTKQNVVIVEKDNAFAALV